jgi:hypothetical protein
MKTWVLIGLVSLPLTALAQLPVPISPDWLKGSEKTSGILNNTHVTLTGNNYVMVQTNVVARSRGFKILGLITLRSASYTEAMSRLYAKAQVKEGQPQAIANVVHESGGLNLILFQIPKIRIRADLIEFTDEYAEEMEPEVPVRVRDAKTRVAR